MKTIFTLIIAVIGSLTVWAQDRGYVHTATEDNLFFGGIATILDHPDLNGHPNAPVLAVNRGGGTDFSTQIALIYFEDMAKWGIYTQVLTELVPVGSKFNVFIADHSAVATYISSPSNTSGNVMDLNDYAREDYLFHTIFNNSGSTDQVDPIPYGTFWKTGTETRAIYKESQTDIAEGAAFKVMKASSESSSMVYQVSSSENTSGNGFNLDHPLLNGNPDAVFLYSHYWGFPGSANAVYLNFDTEAVYNSSLGQWSIYAFDSGGFPVGVCIDIIIPDEIMGTNDAAAQISKVSIYPNPSIDIVNFKSSIKPIQSVEIYDFTGKLIQSTVGNDTTISMNVSAIPSGIYVAKIKTDEGTFSQKLVKK